MPDAGRDNDIAVFLGRGDGTLSLAKHLVAPDHPRAIALVDLDGDHHPELVVVGETAGVVAIFANNPITIIVRTSSRRTAATPR